MLLTSQGGYLGNKAIELKNNTPATITETAKEDKPVAENKES